MSSKLRQTSSFATRAQSARCSEHRGLSTIPAGRKYANCLKYFVKTSSKPSSFQRAQIARCPGRKCANCLDLHQNFIKTSSFNEPSPHDARGRKCANCLKLHQNFIKTSSLTASTEAFARYPHRAEVRQLPPTSSKTCIKTSSFNEPSPHDARGRKCANCLKQHVIQTFIKTASFNEPSRHDARGRSAPTASNVIKNLHQNGR